MTKKARKATATKKKAATKKKPVSKPAQLMKPVKVVEPGTALVRPAMAVARRLDGELVASVRAISTEYMRFLDAAERVIRDKTYEVLGFEDVEDYFETHLGVAYRVVRKRLLINAALRRIPEKFRRQCYGQLVDVGVQRATIIAPVLGQHGDWREWIRQAQDLGLADLQTAVNRVLRARKKKGETEPQPPPMSADAKWLAYTLNVLHPDARDEAEDVFAAGRSALETESNLQVLLVLIRSMAVELYEKARPRGWRPKAEVQAEAEERAAR